MRPRPFLILAAAIGVALLAPRAHAQQNKREIQVRKDKKTFQDSQDWIYENLDEGIKQAKASGKPMMVVFRCIPCEACQEFDDDVARRDPVIKDLLDKYVCVRLVKANTIDLTKFQYDFDMSFSVILMNPDSTIYGRFATRSDRPEEEDISLKGLRQALQRGLRIHASYDKFKPMLAGKQVTVAPKYRTPLEYPSLNGKYKAELDYEGTRLVQSCIHCHQVRDAERETYRASGERMPDRVLYPYPDPEVLGLKFHPDFPAKVETVKTGSIADRAGVKVGDEFESLDGQPLLSIADLQWVLHNTGPTAKLEAEVRRGDDVTPITLELAEGWRYGNISWRATSWELRRMGFGGMRLDDLTDADRKAAGIGHDGMALKARHVGEYGEHALAKKAGLKKGDVILSFGGKSGRMSESDLLVYSVRNLAPGSTVEVKALRDGKPMTFQVTLPKGRK